MARSAPAGAQRLSATRSNTPRSYAARAQFVALFTRARHPLFEVERVAGIFTETLLHYRALGLYRLHAWSLQPDRASLLLTPQSRPLTSCIETLRTAFADRLCDAQPPWEDRFVALPVASTAQLEALRDEMHRAATPPLAGYPYTSAPRPATSAQTELRALRAAAPPAIIGS